MEAFKDMLGGQNVCEHHDPRYSSTVFQICIGCVQLVWMMRLHTGGCEDI